MVTLITTSGSKNEYQGLSVDAKPIISVPVGSTFYEEDTDNGWDYDPNNINPQTGNGWWPV
jgi:hypothetical protein